VLDNGREAVREDAHQHVFDRLRWLARNPQVERLEDAAIHVGKIDPQAVYRRRLRHVCDHIAADLGEPKVNALDRRTRH
jgi:hypothetical protein